MNGDEKQEVLQILAPILVILSWIGTGWITGLLPLAMIYQFGGTLPTEIVPLVLGLSLLGWGGFFIKKVFVPVEQNKQVAVKLFGRVVRVVGPGLRIRWWPFERFMFFPWTNLEMPMFFADIVTRPGKYTWNEGTPEAVEEDLDRLNVGVEAVLYALFGDTEDPVANEVNIRQAAQHLPAYIFADPNTAAVAERLRDFLDSSVDSEMREEGGHRTWGELVNKKGEVSRVVRESLAPTPTYDLSGLSSRFEVKIKEVHLPPAFLAAQTAQAAARLNAKAMVRIAEGQRDATIAAATATAQSTELQAAADLVKAQREADGNLYSEQKRADAELYERNKYYEALGLGAGKERAQFELASEFFEHLPTDMRSIVVGGSATDTMKQFFDVVQGFISPPKPPTP